MLNQVEYQLKISNPVFDCVYRFDIFEKVIIYFQIHYQDQKSFRVIGSKVNS